MCPVSAGGWRRGRTRSALRTRRGWHPYNRPREATARPLAIVWLAERV
jgi:hypothetical protein